MSEENENPLVAAFGGQGGMPATVNANALMQSSARIPKGSDKPYLTFKDGEWTYGQEANECDPDALWIVNPNSFCFGLIEWLDSVAGGEILVPAGTPYGPDDLVLKFDPEDPDHRIAPQIAADFYCLNGEDEGTVVQFKTSTRGGVDALNGLAQKIAQQAIEDAEHVFAIVELDGSSYMHKKYKRKTYVPLLNLIRFDDAEASITYAEDFDNGEGEEEPEAKPEPPKRSGTSKKAAKKAASKKAPAKKAADDDAPPPRRRRAKS